MADDPRPPVDEHPPSTTPDRGRPVRREPRDYRPDLRPMLILVALLAAVVAAWLLLSPLILPEA